MDQKEMATTSTEINSNKWWYNLKAREEIRTSRSVWLWYILQTSAICSPSLWEASDVCTGGGAAKSIPLIVPFDLALVPIPSFKPFDPASFILKRRRAPMEDRRAKFPRELLNTTSGIITGMKLFKVLPELIPIILGTFQLELILLIKARGTYTMKYTTWSLMIILIILTVLRPGSSFNILADLYTASIIKSIPYTKGIHLANMSEQRIVSIRPHRLPRNNAIDCSSIGEAKC